LIDLSGEIDPKGSRKTAVEAGGDFPTATSRLKRPWASITGEDKTPPIPSAKPHAATASNLAARRIGSTIRKG